MGKREETRLLDYYGWSSRHNFTYNMLNEWSCMDEIDTLIKEADELIKGHSDVTPLYYQSQKEKIDELNNNYISYIRYIDDLYMDIYDADHAFFTDIKNNAVEQLSNVKQNKYAVQEGELADKYGFDITLTDFIVGQRTYHGHGTYRLEITELQDFSEMLRTSYEELAEEAEISTADYILKMFENGEYDHSKYHPVKDFISGLLDTATLGILPMAELMAGYDFITGEELSSQEATNKGIEAVMGLVAIALIPFTSGGSVGLKAVGKQILVESATGVVSYTIYEACETMDMPAGITFALSIAGGGLTYKALEGGIPYIKREGMDEVGTMVNKYSTSQLKKEFGVDISQEYINVHQELYDRYFSLKDMGYTHIEINDKILDDMLNKSMIEKEWFTMDTAENVRESINKAYINSKAVDNTITKELFYDIKNGLVPYKPQSQFPEAYRIFMNKFSGTKQVACIISGDDLRNIKTNPLFAKGLGRAGDGVKDSANFVLAMEDVESIINETDDLVELAKTLGLDNTKFVDYGGARLVVIESEEIKNIRYSTSDTLGANEWWAPGMQTSGGQFEAVISRIENVVNNSNVTIEKIKK